jgi:hypothetical protein
MLFLVVLCCVVLSMVVVFRLARVELVLCLLIIASGGFLVLKSLPSINTGYAYRTLKKQLILNWIVINCHQY